MLTDLRGATTPGDPGMWPHSPGELAARWNAMGHSARADFVAVMVANATAAHGCWVSQHVPGDVVRAEVARVRAVTAQRVRAAAFAEAVEALEAAGMGEGARLVAQVGLAESRRDRGRGADAPG